MTRPIGGGSVVVGRRALLAAAVALLLSLAPTVALGQDPLAADRFGSPRGLPASPVLPPDHWALAALRRAQALGLVEWYQPAQRAVPRLLVGTALRDAALRAAREAPPWESLARSWDLAFRDEFRDVDELLARNGVAAGVRGGTLELGLEDQRGRGAAGTGAMPADRTGGWELPDQAGVVVTAALTAALGPHLAVLVEPQLRPDRLDLQGFDLIAGWGPLAFSLGRQTVGYGYGAGGGVVLSGEVALDRLQVETARPLDPPGLLRYLGPTTFTTFLTRFSEERHVGEPFFWGASGSIRPHDRLTLSIHRGAFIGGGLQPGPFTARNLLFTLIGKHADHFANQIVAGELRFRAPTERVLPATLYVEWGAEDSAGAFYKVPGRIFGIYLPALPGVHAVSAGVERAEFGTACCGNPFWYRHLTHSGGWTSQDRPLGHALGGNGWEWLVYSRAELLRARLRLDGRLFRRDRWSENLFSPERQGRSTGVTARAAWRLAPNAEAEISLSREAGWQWTEHAAHSRVRVSF